MHLSGLLRDYDHLRLSTAGICGEGDCITGGATEARGTPVEGGPHVPDPYGGGSDGFIEFAMQMHMELVGF